MNSIIKTPLFNELDSIYTGAICHKNYYLFLNPDKCEVLVFNECLKKISCINTEKYQSITENKKDCYFILTKSNNKDFLYKATYDFLEFDCIELKVPNKYKENINDIYYDEIGCRIFIATNHYIYSITVDGYFIKEEAYTNIFSNPNRVMKNLNGCCVKIPTVSDLFTYTAVGKCIIPYVSYTKNNEAILATLNKDECKNEICLGPDIKIASIFICKGKLILLVIKCNKYNYLYELNIKCDECKTRLHCCEKLDCCEKLHCCEKLDCMPICQKRCIDPVACILESVALEQTALSHILNAEGEKIQKAIADNACIDDLLKINTSVIDTIYNTTILEHVLQEKIDKVMKYECNKKC